ncbi:MAG: hypothetical protein IPL61_09380 [Myxococcales bacterium]|nr:hypothetical protein [Myxococcales bacterium]
MSTVVAPPASFDEHHGLEFVRLDHRVHAQIATEVHFRAWRQGALGAAL